MVHIFHVYLNFDSLAHHHTDVERLGTVGRLDPGDCSAFCLLCPLSPWWWPRSITCVSLANWITVPVRGKVFVFLKGNQQES